MPRRIGRHIGTGAGGAEEAWRDALRDALACWATGVAVVAVRDDDQVHALTVTAFMPVSFEPPLVAIALGGNAAVLPFIGPGTELVVSILSGDQRGIASRYADTFPVGPSPFAEQGPPVVDGAVAVLVCRVEELLPRGDHHLTIARVIEPRSGSGDALVYLRREYDALE